MPAHSVPPHPPSIAAYLRNAAQRLQQLGGLSQAEARLEARLLSMRVLGKDRAWLVAHDREHLSPQQLHALEAALIRRLAGEPVAYILGEREFYGRPFRVSPATLIPRPETEHLVEAALARLPAGATLRVLDIGTGSGCIAITLKLERPDWRVTAVDLSRAALDVASENGRRLGADVTWREGDLFAGLAGQRFDLIVSNPPYVACNDFHLERGDLRFEPRGALVADEKGLAILRAIVKSAPTYLDCGGWLIVEHGWDQGEAVPALLREDGYTAVFMARDLAGQARVSGGRWVGVTDMA